MSSECYPGAGRDLQGLGHCMSSRQLPGWTRSRIKSGMTIKEDPCLLDDC